MRQGRRRLGDDRLRQMRGLVPQPVRGHPQSARRQLVLSQVRQEEKENLEKKVNPVLGFSFLVCLVYSLQLM